MIDIYHIKCNHSIPIFQAMKGEKGSQPEDNTSNNVTMVTDQQAYGNVWTFEWSPSLMWLNQMIVV